MCNISSRSFQKKYETNNSYLNIVIESFPSNIIANMFKFEKRDFFELDEDEQEAKDPVKVDF